MTRILSLRSSVGKLLACSMVLTWSGLLVWVLFGDGVSEDTEINELGTAPHLITLFQRGNISRKSLPNGGGKHFGESPVCCPDGTQPKSAAPWRFRLTPTPVSRLHAPQERLAEGLSWSHDTIAIPAFGKCEDSSCQDHVEELEHFYQRFVSTQHIACNQSLRLGNEGDGGWNICVSGGFRPKARAGVPCLIYSFGVNYDWSFEDAAYDAFRCHIKSFDPSMDAQGHFHSKDVQFYAWGLGPENSLVPDPRPGQRAPWKMRTLSTILAELGHTQRTLDYLKVDIEGWEWSVLRVAIQERSLIRVKQLAVEFHIRDLETGRHNISGRQYREYLALLSSLEELGFRKWYTHHNRFGIHRSDWTKRFISCCVETVYINLHHLGEADPSSPPDSPIVAPKVTPPQDSVPALRRLARTSKWAVTLSYGHTLAEAETVFYEYLAEVVVECPRTVLLGEELDTGWSVCVTPPFRLEPLACLVYSISSESEATTFEEEMSDVYACRVWLIHSRLTESYVIRRRSITFGSLLASPSEARVGSSSRYRPLRNILRENGHYNNHSIDVLRVTLAGGEWDFLMTLTADKRTLSKVKQLVLDVHTREVEGDHTTTSVSDFYLYWSLLTSLENNGFKLWRSVSMNSGLYKSARTALWRPSCVRVHFVNVQFMS